MDEQKKPNKNASSPMLTLGDLRYFDRGVREVDGTAYQRYAVQTHFVGRGEDFTELIRRYISPLFKPGDMVTVGEKVVSMCQDNTVQMEDVHLGFWAKFLSKFATSNAHGIGMDEPYKLQLAIDMKGLPRILWACICHVFGRLFGKRGVFYKIVGQDVAGIDGFYSHSSFDVYHTMAVLNPRDPGRVCAEIEHVLDVPIIIVDANDLNVEILGCATSLRDKPAEFFAELIRDNPAGQDDELTPLILIRPVAEDEAADAEPTDEPAPAEDAPGDEDASAAEPDPAEAEPETVAVE